ncbi:MAG: site-specific integrase, partial [Pseudomonadota bacterium]
MSGNDAAYIDRFLEMMAAETGASPNTLSAYRSDLEQATAMLPGSISTAGKDAMQVLAQGWGDLQSSTVARKSSALRRYFGFLV